MFCFRLKIVRGQISPKQLNDIKQILTRVKICFNGAFFSETSYRSVPSLNVQLGGEQTPTTNTRPTIRLIQSIHQSLTTRRKCSLDAHRSNNRA